MQITTKFNLGDFVFVLQRESLKVIVPCPVCSGAGQIEIKGKKYSCPECAGLKTVSHYELSRWLIKGSGLIASVRTEHYLDIWKKQPHGYEDDIYYQIESTEINNGSLWHEVHLFKGTRKAAQEECDRRNFENLF